LLKFGYDKPYFGALCAALKSSWEVSKKAGGGIKAVLTMFKYEQISFIASFCGICEHCKTEDSNKLRYCVAIINEDRHQSNVLELISIPKG
jgi:hypothetical protein